MHKVEYTHTFSVHGGKSQKCREQGAEVENKRSKGEKEREKVKEEEQVKVNL